MSDVLHVGWNTHLDIPSALRAAEHQLAAQFVLISMIDSTPEVRKLPSLAEILQRLGSFQAEVEDDVVLELSTLWRLIDIEEFFSGFDEMWLFSEMPSAAKPRTLRITSDTHLVAEPPAGVAEWMLETSCRAGLGDGDGLNFATFDSALAGLWRQ